MQMLVKEAAGAPGLCSRNVGNVLPNAFKYIYIFSFQSLNVLQLLLVVGNWGTEQTGNRPEWTRMETDLPTPHLVLSLSSPLLGWRVWAVLHCLVLCSLFAWLTTSSFRSQHKPHFLKDACRNHVDWVWFPCFISCRIRMRLPYFRTHVSLPFIMLNGALEWAHAVLWELTVYISLQLHIPSHYCDSLKPVTVEVWMGRCYSQSSLSPPTRHQRASFEIFSSIPLTGRFVKTCPLH